MPSDALYLLSFTQYQLFNSQGTFSSMKHVIIVLSWRSVVGSWEAE